MEAEVLRAPVVVGGRCYATDQLGYLLDPDEWDREVAVALADIEGIDKRNAVRGESGWRLTSSTIQSEQSVPIVASAAAFW